MAINGLSEFQHCSEKKTSRFLCFFRTSTDVGNSVKRINIQTMPEVLRIKTFHSLQPIYWDSLLFLNKIYFNKVFVAQWMWSYCIVFTLFSYYFVVIKCNMELISQSTMSEILLVGTRNDELESLELDSAA